MKYNLLFVLLLLSTPAAFAENKAYLKDGKIKLETEDKVRSIDYSATGKHDHYNLKNWEVEEKVVDAVAEAVQVYTEKKESGYRRRFVLIDRSNPHRTIIIDNAADQYGGLQFTPAEDFVYYVGLPGTGVSGATGVYGLNLLTQENFMISQGDNLGVETCPDRKSYVVVRVSGKETSYVIYNIYGKKIKDLENISSPEALTKNVCY